MLRIIPALALVVLLSTFVLGPIFTTLSLHDYLLAHGTRFYLWNIALYPVYSLPGMFAGLPYPSVINGSLWSLPAEMAMYIATPLVIGRSAASARCSVAIFFAVSAIAGLYFVRFVTIAPVPVFYGTSVPSVLEMAPYFQIGALYAVFGLNRFGRPLFSIVLFATVGAGLQALSGLVNEYAVAEVLLLATLPYVVISVGSVTVGGALSRLLERGDVSYGLYLYGFPVQQTIATLWPGQIGALGNLALTLPITFVFALFSWKTVEKTALRFKPGRPVRKDVQNADA
jgi:peptidoglycan/LPS O-acetylase OafA/YrhL